MTIAEFKAWLEGYSAHMNVAPTAEEWKVIKAKIEQLQDTISAPYAPYKKPREWWKDDRNLPLEFPTVVWEDTTGRPPLSAH